MKSFSLLVLSVFLLSTTARADAPKGLGLQLGFNLADVSTDSSISTSSTLGYVFGATYDHEFEPNLSLVPGVRLIQRGFGFNVGTTEVDLKITYLELPVMFLARFHGADVVPFFMGGPVLGLKMGTSCSVAGADCTVYDDSGVKSTHLGLEIGGGAIFPLASGAAMSAQLRYHLGLTTVADGLSDPRHRGAIFEAGYLF